MMAFVLQAIPWMCKNCAGNWFLRTIPPPSFVLPKTTEMCAVSWSLKVSMKPFCRRSYTPASFSNALCCSFYNVHFGKYNSKRHGTPMKLPYWSNCSLDRFMEHFFLGLLWVWLEIRHPDLKVSRSSCVKWGQQLYWTKWTINKRELQVGTSVQAEDFFYTFSKKNLICLVEYWETMFLVDIGEGPLKKTVSK